jgi:CheY-like chemotaxis protein
MRCLVIDNDPEDRTLVERLLRQCGYRATCTASAREALDLLGHCHHFDMALVDLDMEGMTGAQAIRELRTLEPGMPLLVVSGFDDHTHVMEAVHSGAHGYLLKDDLVDHLRLALQDLRAGKSPLSAGVASVLLRHLTGRSPAARITPSHQATKLAEDSGRIVLARFRLTPGD